MFADDLGQQQRWNGCANKRNHYQSQRVCERRAVLSFAMRKSRKESANARPEVNRQAENGPQLNHNGVHLPEWIIELNVEQRFTDPQMGR